MAKGGSYAKSICQSLKTSRDSFPNRLLEPRIDDNFDTVVWCFSSTDVEGGLPRLDVLEGISQQTYKRDGGGGGDLFKNNRSCVSAVG